MKANPSFKNADGIVAGGTPGITGKHLQQNSVASAAPGPDAETNSSAKIKTNYWIFTALFAGLMIVSRIGYSVAAAPVVEGMKHLGYPFYLVRFLGIAKLLGAVAILSGRFPRIKEWAYAGFAFNLLGAAYSHACSGDGPKVLIPLVVLSLGTGSYHYWRQLARSQAQHAVA